MLPHIDVVGSPVTALPFQEQLATILAWARSHERRMVCVANVHMLMEARWDEGFGKLLRRADMVTPDGTPLVWMMRRLGAPGQDRVAGMDMLPALCRLAAREGVGVYFLGSTPETLARMRARLERECPALRIAGMESPPFRPLTPEEDAEQVERIRASGAGLVLVSLGCPKQERWMEAHRERLPAVLVGLGAAFPVYAGDHRMAPEWMRRSGLEWAYRMAQEPRRLFKRYWRTNLPFLYLAFRQLSVSR